MSESTAPAGPGDRRQAVAPPTQPFGGEAFEAGPNTVLRWLGMAGSSSTAEGRS